jgi:DnaJ-domain-containing protein 1
MTDYFAVLGEDRCPWIEPALLKKRFLALSAEFHPDRVHCSDAEAKALAQHRYAELNQAYNHLRQPKERLQNLLELENGIRPQQVQQIPTALMEFFIQVGQVFKQADSFLIEKARTTSPLLQVQLFERGQIWTDKLGALNHDLSTRQQELIEELKILNSKWIAREELTATERANLLQRLEELYRLFGYYAKWESQVQERLVQLAL